MSLMLSFNMHAWSRKGVNYKHIWWKNWISALEKVSDLHIICASLMAAPCVLRLTGSWSWVSQTASQESYSMYLHNLNLVLSRQTHWRKIFENLGSLTQVSCYRILRDTEEPESVSSRWDAGGQALGWHFIGFHSIFEFLCIHARKVTRGDVIEQL